MKQLKKVFSSVDAIIWFILAFLIVAMIAVPNFATMNNFREYSQPVMCFAYCSMRRTLCSA